MGLLDEKGSKSISCGTLRPLVLGKAVMWSVWVKDVLSNICVWLQHVAIVQAHIMQKSTCCDHEWCKGWHNLQGLE